MHSYELYACIGSGNCFKPWLAMAQLDIAYDLHLIDVLSGEQRSEAYLAVNPLGVVPFLKTPEGKWIGESGAMLWHLCEGSWLMPESRDKRAEALQWMFFEQSKLEPFISPARFFTTILPEMYEDRKEEICEWRSRSIPGLTHLDRHLAKGPFVLGEEYSLADIALFGYVHVLEEAGLSLADFSNVATWIDRVSATQGFVPLSQLGRDAAQAVA